MNTATAILIVGIVAVVGLLAVTVWAIQATLRLMNRWWEDAESENERRRAEWQKRKREMEEGFDW